LYSTKESNSGPGANAVEGKMHLKRQKRQRFSSLELRIFGLFPLLYCYWQSSRSSRCRSIGGGSSRSNSCQIFVVLVVLVVLVVVVVVGIGGIDNYKRNAEAD
jgi:hypothetical protein